MPNRRTQEEPMTPARQLFHALKNNDRDGIWQALQADPSLVNMAYGCNTGFAIHWAVVRDDLPLVSWLLDHGSLVDTPGHFCCTPLGLAVTAYKASETRDTIIRLLIEAGSDVNLMQGDPNGMLWRSPFGQAVWSGNIPLVQRLISLGADVERQCFNNDTPLFLALRKKNHAMITALCQGGADPNKVIHELLDAQTIRVLIDAGADVSYRDEEGRTPLHFQAFRANPDLQVINTLIGAGADVDARDSYGETALHLAVFFDSINMICGLLEHGANPNVVSNNGCVLSEAVWHGSDTTLSLLLQAGADPDTCDVDGFKVLHWMYVRLGEMSFQYKSFWDSADIARLMLARTPRLAVASPSNLSRQEILKVIEADMPQKLRARITRWEQNGFIARNFGPRCRK